MHNWIRQLGAVAVLVALAGSAFPQSSHSNVTAANVQSDFSADHQALVRMADTTLRDLTRELEVSSQAGEIATPSTLEPDAAFLHEFALKYWNGNDEAVRRAVTAVIRLRPLLTPILNAGGVPHEVRALVLVESGGRSDALSPKGARGIWQLMPDTARRYGLTVNGETDERLDVEKSTRAATRYLRALYLRFGDWSLVLAAYNAGENLVEKAVVTARSKDFRLLSNRRLIPTETRTYVPAVLAASDLLTPNSLLGSSGVRVQRSAAVLYASSVAGD